jgi:hypothetical protein
MLNGPAAWVSDIFREALKQFVFQLSRFIGIFATVWSLYMQSEDAQRAKWSDADQSKHWKLLTSENDARERVANSKSSRRKS